MRRDIKRGVIIKLKKTLYSSRRIGKMKEKYFKRLADRYQFDRWHVVPVNFRPYGMGIIEYLNKALGNGNGRVVEIGCGMGEIIGNINTNDKTGYDIDPKVLRAAKRIYIGTKFRTGTFQDVEKQNIEYLITVNFIHGTSPADLREIYRILSKKNNIGHFVLDIVKDDKYEFNHDIDFLFDGLGYRIQKRLHVYKTLNGCRWIYIMEKDDTCNVPGGTNT